MDFNPSLEAHLKDMLTRRDTGQEWLFPSSQRGREDQHALSYRETLLMAREASGLEHVGFHDCRHHFISMSVMAGIDYMTIAAWVGHKDGGILIGKVYGHLANEHRRRAGCGYSSVAEFYAFKKRATQRVNAQRDILMSRLSY